MVKGSDWLAEIGKAAMETVLSGEKEKDRQHNVTVYSYCYWKSLWLVSRTRDEGKLLAVVENIVDLNEFFAIIFDEPDIAVSPTAINLHWNL
jgi:hypothetical protein